MRADAGRYLLGGRVPRIRRGAVHHRAVADGGRRYGDLIGLAYSRGPPMNENVRPATPIVRVVLASFIGTSIEWYDFFLYGTAAALVFNRLFFPTLDPFAGTMASFATYAVGFFARPLGGVIFGHYGDKIGRKKALMTTLMMMGVATVCVGLLPAYAKVGVLAPVLLVLLRVVQGIAVGGEWGGAVLMAAEHAPKGRRTVFA